MNDLKNSTFDEVGGKIADLKEELRKERLDLMTGKSKNSSVIKKLRRNIARAETVRKTLDA